VAGFDIVPKIGQLVRHIRSVPVRIFHTPAESPGNSPTRDKLEPTGDDFALALFHGPLQYYCVVELAVAV